MQDLMEMALTPKDKKLLNLFRLVIRKFRKSTDLKAGPEAVNKKVADREFMKSLLAAMGVIARENGFRLQAKLAIHENDELSLMEVFAAESMSKSDKYTWILINTMQSAINAANAAVPRLKRNKEALKLVKQGVNIFEKAQEVLEGDLEKK